MECERKEDFFVYISDSAYRIRSKEVENHIFRLNFIFRYTCMYQLPILTKLLNYNVFCKYYIVISDTLIGCRLCFSYCLPQYHQSFKRNQEKNLNYKKCTQNNLCEGHHFFDCTLSFLSYVIFVVFLVYSLPFLCPGLTWKKILVTNMVREMMSSLPPSVLLIYYIVCRGI